MCAKTSTSNIANLSPGGVSDVLAGYLPPLLTKRRGKGRELRVLSLFSGCGGMDLGMEGGFICHRKSVDAKNVVERINADWVRVRPTAFRTVFANDILPEARHAWLAYFTERGHGPEEFHFGSIVDLVKLHGQGKFQFPDDIDVVTGGFPCQDFSLAGKRRGFESLTDHNGRHRADDIPSEETRGKLYCWMKQVVEIVRPKVFIAENVKGLVNLGDVRRIIQNDFSTAANGGYVVLNPRVLHAADYGVPEARERVIFIGLRRDALRPEALEALEHIQEGELNFFSEYDPYPRPTHRFTKKSTGQMERVSCRDVFANLPEPEASTDPSQRFYSNAKYMGTHCQGQKEIDIEKLAPTIRSEHHGNIEFRRLSAEHGGKNSQELAKGMEERRLTPRECAMIQTFPPDYPFVRLAGKDERKAGGRRSRFAVSASEAYKVIGNAVPPMLAYNLALRLEALWGVLFK